MCEKKNTHQCDDPKIKRAPSINRNNMLCTLQRYNCICVQFALLLIVECEALILTIFLYTKFALTTYTAVLKCTRMSCVSIKIGMQLIGLQKVGIHILYIRTYSSTSRISILQIVMLLIHHYQYRVYACLAIGKYVPTYTHALSLPIVIATFTRIRFLYSNLCDLFDRLKKKL